MKLFDVNVLVNNHRSDSPHQPVIGPWFADQINEPGNFALSELVLSAFVRIVTNHKIFKDPTPVAMAVAEVRQLLARPNCVLIRPGPAHMNLFLDLCEHHNARANLVPDVYLAALAIEHRCEWVSDDGGFGRFEELNWTRPPKGSGVRQLEQE